MPALCDLLNEVIRVGGATIFERPITVEAFIDHFFKSQIQISFLVAAADTGELLGFQVLLTHEQLPDDWADIATFARVGSQALEIGRALFAETRPAVTPDAPDVAAAAPRPLAAASGEVARGRSA